MPDLPDYIERQEGPDGQHCDLLTRVPYDRHRMIEIGLMSARSTNDQMDVALRAMLWIDFEPPKVRHSLTREWSDDIGAAGADVIQPWRERAMELYNNWFTAAMPGPKGSTGKPGKPTPSGPRKPKALATSGPR